MGEPGIYGWIHTDKNNGVTFHRVREPLRVAAAQVPTFTGSALADDVLEQCDTVVTQMLHDERATEGWHRLSDLGTHRLVIDVDDAMWQPDWTPFRKHYTQDAVDRLLSNVQRAHVVTTPSPLIASMLSDVNRNVWVVPNTVPAAVRDLYRPDRSDRSDKMTVGYQGSPSHAQDWPQSTRIAVARTMLDTGTTIKFAGLGSVPDGWGDLAVATPWQPAGSIEYYRSLDFHVGIGPLRDTYFNRCKSGLRAVEYAARGIVAVLPGSPNIYHPFVADGVTGVLLRPHQTLRRVLTRLLDSPETIDAMGAQAYAASAHWTTEARIDDWMRAWVSR